MRMRMCMCVCVLVLNMIQLTRIPLHIGKQAFVYSGQACKLLILYYSATGRRPQCLPYPTPRLPLLPSERQILWQIAGKFLQKRPTNPAMATAAEATATRTVLQFGGGGGERGEEC